MNDEQRLAEIRRKKRIIAKQRTAKIKKGFFLFGSVMDPNGNMSHHFKKLFLTSRNETRERLS